MRSLTVVRTGLAWVAVLDAQHFAGDFEVECPLMSLPGGYLGADAKTALEKFIQFTSLRPGPRIGIAWAGNPRYKADRLRSMRLETLLPLLRSVDANWISLQKGESTERQIAALPNDVTVRDGSSRDRDLADTAALIATLDLVITTDTSIAHLAGAMGKPVWILLPHLSDWRWMQEIETTPWYPTARLFRQKAPGDWRSVLNCVADELNGPLQTPSRMPGRADSEFSTR